jgi:hypothetical protein
MEPTDPPSTLHSHPNACHFLCKRFHPKIVSILLIESLGVFHAGWGLYTVFCLRLPNAQLDFLKDDLVSSERRELTKQKQVQQQRPLLWGIRPLHTYLILSGLSQAC